MQLSLATVGRVGHHWRTKWALSGNQKGDVRGVVSEGGKWNGRVRMRGDGTRAETDAVWDASKC